MIKDDLCLQPVLRRKNVFPAKEGLIRFGQKRWSDIFPRSKEDGRRLMPRKYPKNTRSEILQKRFGSSTKSARSPKQRDIIPISFSTVGTRYGSRTPRMLSEDFTSMILSSHPRSIPCARKRVFPESFSRKGLSGDRTWILVSRAWKKKDPASALQSGVSRMESGYFGRLAKNVNIG